MTFSATPRDILLADEDDDVDVLALPLFVDCNCAYIFIIVSIALLRNTVPDEEEDCQYYLQP